MAEVKICEMFAGLEDGGLENHVFDLANGLSEKHEVHAIAHRRYREFFNAKVHFHPIDLGSNRRNPFMLWKLYRTLRRISPDVLHVHANKAAAMVATLRRFLPFPCVATVHNLKRSVQMFKAYDQLIAVSEGITKPLNHPHLKVIYNGRNITARPKQKQAEHPVLLCLARLVPAKGIDILLPAFAQVLKTFPRAELNIAGDGAQEAEMKALSKKLGVDKQVNFLGFRTDADVLLSQSDCLVISSRREGFPLVMVETLQSRLPIVSTKVPGAAEVLAPELLVEIEDIDGLAQCIVFALEDKERLDQLMQPIYQFAHDNLSFDAQFEKTEALLIEVAQREAQA